MKLAMPEIETDRLRIRPFLTADLEAADALLMAIGWCDQEASEALRQYVHRRWLLWNTLNHQEQARLGQPPFGDRAIVQQSSGALIGLCGLVPAFGPFGRLAGWGRSKSPLYRPEIGLVWAVHPDHQSQGYATEAAAALIDFAFAELCLARIVATTTEDNPASIQVMVKLGMRLERNPDPEPEWFQVIGVLDNAREASKHCAPELPGQGPGGPRRKMSSERIDR